MSDQYVGEIRAVGFNYATDGWLTCDGTMYQVGDFEELSNLIGNTFGGDGMITFAVPDLRSRVPIGAGNGPGLSSYAIGQTVGVESVTLDANTTAPHNHLFVAITDSASTTNPGGAVPAATSATATLYSDQQPFTSLASSAVTPYGSSQPHANIQPCQAQNYIIAYQGYYPSSSQTEGTGEALETSV